MTSSIIDTLENILLEKFKSKTHYIENFVALDTGPEEWFRIEILDAVRYSKSIQVLSTNQIYKELPGRPDFVFKYGDREYVVELKVLPPDRNYSSGYQRFCAGKTNKADFDGLSNGEIDFIIYIHWPSQEDYEKTKSSILKRYSVCCSIQQEIEFNNGCFTLSYWQRNV